MWVLCIYWRDGVVTVEGFDRVRPAWREGQYQVDMGEAVTYRVEFVG